MSRSRAIDIPSSSYLHMSISISPGPTGLNDNNNNKKNNKDNLDEAALYFGYGSNLWKAQMRLRCPTSQYLGIARLRGYKWIIYERGYANIVKLDQTATLDTTTSKKGKEPDYTHEVWGLVYSLEQSDEKGLDRNEGVPVAYQKAQIECEFWPVKRGSDDECHGEDDDTEILSRPDMTIPPVKRSMLVYINHTLKKESSPKTEYIYRMNQGIHDALEEGMPPAYVRQVMRRFIPEKDPEAVAEIANRQALAFNDEK